MLCTNPINVSSGQVSCGQCGPCRVDKVRLKTAQLILEYQMHSKSAFVTHTYSPEHLPMTPQGIPTVSNQHLRKITQDLRELGITRFLAVSEYGDKSGRPHYHTCLFGVDALELDSYYRNGGWPYGYTHTKPLTESAQMAYIAGYCWKKRKEQEYLPGQEPVQQVRPWRPALGRPMVEHTARHLKNSTYFHKLRTDVPHEFTWQGKRWPYSDQQKRLMRKILGRPVTMCENRDLGFEAFGPVRAIEDIPVAERIRKWEMKLERNKIYESSTQKV